MVAQNDNRDVSVAGSADVLSITDANLTIKDDVDGTKAFKFQASGITTGQTRTLTVPDADLTIVGLTTTQTLTNKTLTSPIVAILKPVSDSTTAIQLTKADGSTAVVTLDTANGNVGIGGTPTYKFDVLNGRSRLTAASEQYSLGLRYGSTTGTVWLGASNEVGSAADYIVSNEAGVERFRVEGSTGALFERNRTTPMGEWITRTFAAGNYTGSVSMTWTVASGDVTTDAYELTGKKLSYFWQITSSTVGGTASNILQIAIPGGFTSAKRVSNTMVYIDNGSTETVGYAEVLAGGTLIRLLKIGVGNWTASTDMTYSWGQITFEIQ